MHIGGEETLKSAISATFRPPWPWHWIGLYGIHHRVSLSL